MKRFILIILDGFGIGYMDDVLTVRPQDLGANTCRHIMEKSPGLRLPHLESMGLMNALGEEIGGLRKNSHASYGVSDLAHFGADTFNGHQEIMGTKPMKPIEKAFSMVIEEVYGTLKKIGYDVRYMGDDLKYLLVNNCVTVADNIEADMGQVYNITSCLDVIDFHEVLKIGRIVRNIARVSRVIAFGGEGVTVNDLISAAEEKDNKFVGINAPKSGVYKKGYRVIHMGYGVDSKVQVPTILNKAGIDVTLLGKVADLVENEKGKSIPCVDTEETMKLVLKELQLMEYGFIAANIQETDLAGHAQDICRYAEKLKISDCYIGEIMRGLKDDDILMIMADHGNDPTIGHSHHTREKVPILIYGKKVKSGFIGHRRTLSDVGATIAEYFSCESPENGSSFLQSIKNLFSKQ